MIFYSIVAIIMICMITAITVKQILAKGPTRKYEDMTDVYFNFFMANTAGLFASALWPFTMPVLITFLVAKYVWIDKK